MKRTQNLLATLTLAAVAALFLASGALQAAPVLFVGTSTDGTRNWDNPDAWDDGQPAQSGNDYLVDPTDPGTTADADTLRSEQTENPTFPGDSLTVQNGGALALRSYANDPAIKSDNNNTITINNLSFDQGELVQGWDDVTLTLEGDFDIRSGGLRVWTVGGGDAPRVLEIGSLISGSGALTVEMNDNEAASNPGHLKLTNASNTWAGDVILSANTAGDFTVEYAMDHSSSSLTADGGTWDLMSYTHTFAAGDVGSTTLSPGTYDADALNAYSGTTFSGSGGIQIIPEPASFALLFLGGVALLRRRRRR